MAASMRAAMSGLLRRNALAFSRPWPMRWLSWENHEPDFSPMPALTTRTRVFPLFEPPPAVDVVDLVLLDGGGELVLHHLDAGLVADHLVTLLDGADAADVEAHRGVEFERMAARGGLGRAV